MHSTETDSSMGPQDGTSSVRCTEVSARHVGSCVQHLLVEVGCYLPSMCTMAATSGALDLLASPSRSHLSATAFQALCGLFVTQETLASIVSSAFLQGNTPFKGRTPGLLVGKACRASLCKPCVQHCLVESMAQPQPATWCALQAARMRLMG